MLYSHDIKYTFTNGMFKKFIKPDNLMDLLHILRQKGFKI